MSALARPLTLALLLSAAALSLHPSAAVARLLPGHALVSAALPTLAALALLARATASRAEERAGAWAIALGALLALAGLATDGVAGHHGSLTLGEGELATSFEETGRAGARLGLRPLGFPVAGERVTAAGEVALMLPDQDQPITLSRERALRIGGYRLAQPIELEPGVARIQVHREPAAPLLLAGALLLALGCARLVLRRPWPAESAVTPLLLAGGVFVFSLSLADRGSVLGWSYGVATRLGRVALPGVGVLLGLALLAGLLGTSLLAAWRSSNGAAWAPRPARLALWLAVALAVAGLGLAVARLALVARVGLPAGPASLAAATAFLAVTLAATRTTSPSGARVLALAWPAAGAATFALALAAALVGLARDGTYATPAAAAASSAALLGLAALEPTALAPALRIAFLLALAALPLV